MSRKTYTAQMPWGDTLTISADLTQASAPILYAGPEEYEGEKNWVSTPYQTADARHREVHAMMLAVEYAGAEWYRAPNDRRPAAKILAEIRRSITVQIGDEVEA